MQYLLTADIFSILVLAVVVLGILSKKNKTESSVALGLVCIAVMICSFSEAMCYALVGRKDTDIVLVIIGTTAYSFGSVAMLMFVRYWYIYINEKMEIRKIIPIIPSLILTIAFVYNVYAGLSGQIFSVKDGTVTVTGGQPTLVIVAQIVVFIYLPVVAWIKRKNLGVRTILLLGVFGVLPLATSAYTLISGDADFSYSASTLAILFQYVVLENQMLAEREKEQRNTLTNKNIELSTKISEITELNDSLEYQMSITRSMNRVYYSSYYIDMETDYFIEISSRQGIRDVVGVTGGAQSNLDLMIEHLIVPKYAEEMRQFVNLSTLNERLKDKDFITFEYQGRLSGWSQAYFIAGDRDSTGKLKSVFYATRQCHDEKAREQQSMAIIEGLSSEYHTILLTNKDTLELSLLRSSGISTIPSALEMVKKCTNYDEAVKFYIENYVETEDKVRLLKSVSSAEVIKQLETKTLYTVNYFRRKDDGTMDYHQIAFINADSVDGTKQFVFGFRDIDSIIKEEQAIKQQLRDAKLSAEEANQAKTAFLSNMSHDIRTPMNAIVGFATLMKKHTDNPEVISDCLDKIKSSSEYLLTIVNNVLDMARIESGNIELNEEFMDLCDPNQNPLGVFDEQIKSKKIKFSGKQDFIHRYAFVDSTKVHQITVNLVSNAIKYTPEGGSVSADMWEIPSDKEGYGRYVLEVADTGIGMSPEFKDHVFDTFAREKNTTESKIIGTGLGMSIVKKLVDLMGGTIEVWSEQGKGTKFTVIMDHRIVENPEEYLAKLEASSTPSFISLKGKRILIAEDNELNAEIAVDLLTDEGIEVEIAQDGYECIDMLTKADPGYYDFILMDVQMPNLNGYETTKAIREMDDQEKSQIPIIALTANAFLRDRRQAIESGMNGHVAKPIDVNKLLEELSKVI